MLDLVQLAEPRAPRHGPCSPEAQFLVAPARQETKVWLDLEVISVPVAGLDQLKGIRWRREKVSGAEKQQTS